jgi:Transglutaminase-like superfamily/Coenzyme PQQ synthesis protein D (PqqD)
MNCNLLEESRSQVVVVGPGLARLELQRGGAISRPWPVLLDRQIGAGNDSSEVGRSKSDRITWRFRPQVTLIVQDGAARVLDPQSGKFYALDPLATGMLFRTLEVGSEAMVREVAQEYQVDEIQVRSDWDELVEQLRKAGLTEAVCLKEGEHELPGRFSLWVRLSLASLSFRFLGWEKTLRIWRRRARPKIMGTAEQWESVVAAVDSLVRRIASRHLLNPQCKERALTSWHILTGMGLPAKLLMGVMLYPFTAHAWTECHGQVVGDDRARCEQFVPVAVYA